MAKYGRASNIRKATCVQELQDIADDVIFQLPWTDSISGITINDVSFVCGYRNEVEQDLALKLGFSRVQWPDGNHNTLPSPAMDLVPYHAERPHIRWQNIDEMEALNRLVMQCAEKRGITLRWGGDWDRDGIRVDRDSTESLLDGPHYEIVKDV